jgi:antitoxin VapB
MQLNIKDPKAHRMAQELARLTGESMTQAVVHALETKLAQVRAKARPEKADVRAKILALVEEVKTLPVDDDRHPDDMLYDEDGLPPKPTIATRF